MPLIGTLTSGVSAVNSFSKGLEVIGANIANVNTTAYKGESTTFADTFSNTLRAADATQPAVQIGTGVQVSGINTNFGQGSLSTTGKPTDLGISGEGYFVVQDASGNQYATRDGSFHFDTNGNLVNQLGYGVLDKTGAAVTVPSYSSATSISIGADGTVTAAYPPGFTGTTTPVQQVGVMIVPDQSKLLRQGNNLYDFSQSGAVATTSGTMGAANANGRGKIEAGTLELSNVDLTEQFSNLITTQRSFQAGARLITVSDSVLDDIVNLKRS